MRSMALGGACATVVLALFAFAPEVQSRALSSLPSGSWTGVLQVQDPAYGDTTWRNYPFAIDFTNMTASSTGCTYTGTVYPWLDAGIWIDWSNCCADTLALTEADSTLDGSGWCIAYSGRRRIQTHFTAYPLDAGACCNPTDGSCTVTTQQNCPPPDVWQSATSCSPPPCNGAEYAIVSATFAESVYQNGVDTALLTVVTKSSWGGGPVQLNVTLVTTEGVPYSLGADDFVLNPGYQHNSSFSFAVPACPAPVDFTVQATLTQGGAQVASYAGLGFTGTPLSPTQIDNEEQQLQNCEVVPQPDALALDLDDIVSDGELVSPILGPMGSVVGMFEDVCASEVYREHNDSCREEGTLVMTVMGGASAVLACCALDYVSAGLAVPEDLAFANVELGVWGYMEDGVGDEIMNTVCGGQPPPLLKRHSLDIGDGNAVRALLPNVIEVGDSLGMTFSAQVGIEGPVKARVSMPIGWISTDSTSIGLSAARALAPDTLQWLMIGPQAERLTAARFDTTMAPSDSLWPKTITLWATKPGNVFLGFACRPVRSQSAVTLFYPTVAVRDSTRMFVTFGDSLGNYPLQVDWNGDGKVDTLLYPEGASSVDGGMGTVDAGPSIKRAEVRPNPGVGSANLMLETTGNVWDARVDIWDAAGRKVRSIGVGDLGPGVRHVVWDGRDDGGRRVGSGVYFFRVVHRDGKTGTKRLVMLK